MPPPSIQQTFDLALQHHQAGRLREAEQLYRQVLARQGDNVDALHLLGVVAHQQGRDALSVDLIRRAIAVRPEHAEAYGNLGNALMKLGQLDEAVAAYRQAVALKPNLPEILGNLGHALTQQGRIDEAIAACHQAIAIRPNHANAHCSLGNALARSGRMEEAISAYRQATALKPAHAEAWSNLGNALRERGQLDEAIAVCRRAIALNPGLFEAHNNLAMALLDKGKLDEAMSACRAAIALRPDDADAHKNLGMMLLLEGDFLHGWQEYEWRSRCADIASPRPNFSHPQWDGSDPAGRTILLHAEQAYGDAIQFARYIPLVLERGANVVVECLPALKRLLQSSARGWQVIARGEPLPAFEFHYPLLSLPLAFGTTLQTIPNRVPYLRAESRMAEQWHDRFQNDQAGLKVGVVWAGSGGHTKVRHRSVPLALLAPLARVPGVSFYSLQTGQASAETKDPACAIKLIDWTAQLNDFADTAGLIAHLDLVISVDTAVAHLAGAMGKPVWTLLPFAADWRWLLDREDSPWYPTMRLFRQPSIGDWNSVILQVTAALRSVAEKQ